MSNEMLDLANRFMHEHLMGKPDVTGILLRGSSAIGVSDEFVDLDFDLVVSQRFLDEEQPTADETNFEGVEVCWGYKSLDIIDGELKDWLRDTDLWAYSTGRIMYDPSGALKALLDRYRKYPEPVRQEKMFSYFYHATAASPYNSHKAIHRQEYATAQFFLVHAAELYASLLYLINRSFIPYRKWRIRQLDQLPRKPDEFVERISEVVFDAKPPDDEGLKSKETIVTQIMNEVRSMLIQEGVSHQRIGDDIWRYEPKYIPQI